MNVLTEWEVGENGKPSPPKELQQRFYNLANKQMEKYLAEGLLQDRFTLRMFAVDLMATAYKMCMADVAEN